MFVIPVLRRCANKGVKYVQLATCKKCTTATGNSSSSSRHVFAHDVPPPRLLFSPAVIRSVIYVPPALKKPVVLPTLQSLTEYNLPSIVKPTDFAGDLKTIIAPSTDASIQTEKVDPETSTVTKQAAELIQIRKRKMKKHKLKKLRKRMHFLWAKRRFRREKKKEQLFRAELISQIQEAHSFDAEKYVTGVLEKLRNRPKPETPEERRERFLDLMRKYKSNVTWVKPKFD